MTTRKIAALVVLLCAMPIFAHAAQLLPAPAEKTTAQQCSACHMAYPPRMLPARSWQALMSDLSHHFGEDASISDQDRATITGYLTTPKNAPIPITATPQ